MTIDAAYTAMILLVAPACVMADDEQGFRPLFDGRSLAGWTGAADSYEVIDGTLACKPGGGGKLYTERDYADFVLRFEFKLTPGANNGIGLRTPTEGDPAYVGMESQVLDNSAEKFADLKPYQRHGSIYGVAAAEAGALRPVGEWNEQEIRCAGRRVRVVLNGEVIVDVDLDRVAPEGKTLDGRRHPGLERASGRVGLLGHGARVWFRNIRIKELVE